MGILRIPAGGNSAKPDSITGDLTCAPQPLCHPCRYMISRQMTLVPSTSARQGSG